MWWPDGLNPNNKKKNTTLSWHVFYWWSSEFYVILGCFRVRNWATKLGGELWHFGELVTRKNKVKDVSINKKRNMYSHIIGYRNFFRALRTPRFSSKMGTLFLGLSTKTYQTCWSKKLKLLRWVENYGRKRFSLGKMIEIPFARIVTNDNGFHSPSKAAALWWT